MAQNTNQKSGVCSTASVWLWNKVIVWTFLAREERGTENDWQPFRLHYVSFADYQA